MSSISLHHPPASCVADDVRAAIVVPTYKHSGLLAEALDTALAQDTDFAYAVVLVNDGCPFPETDRVCREFAAAHPGRLYYLHKRNGGLSAARNTGIAFALDAFPALEAVYFLDSDNRIRPHLLQRMLDALRAGGPEVGWAYPDVDKFGFFEFCDMSGPYSPLEHLFRNVSEAGSMASRRMLDAGLRFDESMKQGSEDWEFWLQGLERGFRGVHVPGSGFGYRRRGESMLTESERDYRPILTHIQGRHPALFNVKAIARAEAAIGRRYAVFLPDKGVVRCTTDPAEGDEDLTLAEFARRLLRAPERPDYAGCPGHLAVMDSGLYELLLRQRLLQGVLWTLERAAAQAMVVSGRVMLEKGEGCAMEWRGTAIGLDDTQPAPLPSGGADMVALETRILLDLVRSQPTGAPELEREYIKPCVEARLDLRLCVPEPVASSRTADAALASLYEALATQWSDRAFGGWASAQIDRYRSGVASPRDVYWLVHQLPSVLPVVPNEAGRKVALVVEPGSADKLEVAVRLAGWLRGLGCEPHLVTMGKGVLRWAPETASLFGSIIPFPAPLVLPEQPLTRRNAYLGTPVRGLREDEDMAAGTLAAFDLVITVQHGPAHSLMGRLRKLGVTTWAVLGLAEEGRAPADIVNACAAFEHAYQTIVPLDARTFRLCQALALPLDKLRRWDGEDAGEETDWRDCPALSLPAAT